MFTVTMDASWLRNALNALFNIAVMTGGIVDSEKVIRSKLILFPENTNNMLDIHGALNDLCTSCCRPCKKYYRYFECCSSFQPGFIIKERHRDLRRDNGKQKIAR